MIKNDGFPLSDQRKQYKSETVPKFYITGTFKCLLCMPRSLKGTRHTQMLFALFDLRAIISPLDFRWIGSILKEANRVRLRRSVKILYHVKTTFYFSKLSLATRLPVSWNVAQTTRSDSVSVYWTFTNRLHQLSRTFGYRKRWDRDISVA